jgi:hypothetical protein
MGNSSTLIDAASASFLASDAQMGGARPARQVEAWQWGWLPALSVVGACGLLLVATAYTGARMGMWWSPVLQWAGEIVLFAPLAGRLLSRRPTREERVGLVVVLGVLLYLVRVLFSPLEFKFVDEFQHLRSTQDVLLSHHLFQNNPILPISPLYPGLEIVASALVSLSKLPIFPMGIILIGAARLVMVLGLYLFYEEASKSAWIAGVASMLYMTNAHYQSLAAMFIYEALALPVATLVLFAVARSEDPDSVKRLGMRLTAMLGLVAVVITHHLTGQILVAFLILWSVVAALLRYARRGQSNPGGTAILALVLALTWIAYVAPMTVNYAGGPLLGAIREVIRLILAPEAGAETIRLPGGPLLERVISLAAIGLIVLGLPFGLSQIWRRYRANSLVLALAAGSFGYIGTLALRLSPRGAELTGRAWPFVLLFVAFVLATGIVHSAQGKAPRWLMGGVIVGSTVTLFLGGITSGRPPYWGRLPGPYRVAAFEASVEP